ncbi:hypothetical protein NVIRENTERO_03613 [Sodalis praecaptivus]|nr:hypothetical protein NVIRENTERO_03613 [Sodalis praecaptivus]
MTDELTISPGVGGAKDQLCRGLLVRCEARGGTGRRTDGRLIE